MSVCRPIFALFIFSIASAVNAAADIHGTWQVRNNEDAVLRPVAGQPKFTPEGEKAYARNRSGVAKHDVQVDLVQRCSTPGVPRLMLLPYPFEIFQGADQVTLVFEWNQLFRQIVLGGKRDPYVQPSAIGYSAGRWEGETLVVTTTDFNDKTLLDSTGLPHDDKLRMTERFTLKQGGKILEAQLTIDDPQIYVEPWQAVVEFQRVKAPLAEDVCLDRVQAGRPPVEKPAQRRDAKSKHP